MGKRIHKDWLKAYMEYSAHSEAPDKFHFWTGISVLAGALRRRVWIDMGYFQWTPNFYIVFVAPPGIVSKSTTASIGMNLLKQIPDVTFGPDAVTWQSLVQSLAQSTETMELIDKSTGEIFHHAMSAITINSSEFGTFLNPNDREMVDVLVSLWDGQIGTWKKATKTQGDDAVENPWINIVACTTPAWIAGNFPEYMIGGGFTSRTVFVYAEEKRRLVPYPADVLPKNFKQMEKELVHDLEIIASEMKGEYTLSPAARKWGEEWYEKHYEKKPAHLDNERFGGYLARKQTHIHKLSMVLAASQSNSLIIEKEHLITADAVTTVLEYDMPKVFANIGTTDITRAISEVINYVQGKGKIGANELYQNFITRVGFTDFEEVLRSCMKAGYIEQRNEGNQIVFYATEAAHELLKTNVPEDLSQVS